MAGRILFGWAPDWRAGLMRAADNLGLKADMAVLTETGPEGYDAVVPLGLLGQGVVESWRQAGRDVRALVIPKAVRDLCHDKRALNRALQDLGFARHVPPEIAPDRLIGPGCFPVVFKRRGMDTGKGVRVITGPADLAEVRGALEDGTGFLQAFIPGEEEHAVHILRKGGQTIYRAAIRYRMAGPGLVKGLGVAPVEREWLTAAPFAPLWDRMADAIGLTEGTACIDFRQTPQGPMLFEINARMGGSLSQRAGRYLQVYLQACGA